MLVEWVSSVCIRTTNGFLLQETPTGQIGLEIFPM